MWECGSGRGEILGAGTQGLKSGLITKTQKVLKQVQSELKLT